MRAIALVIGLTFCSCKQEMTRNKIVGKWELVQTIYNLPAGDTTIDHEYDYKLYFGDDGFYDYDLAGTNYKHMSYRLEKDTIYFQVGKERKEVKLKIQFLGLDRIGITDSFAVKSTHIFRKIST